MLARLQPCCPTADDAAHPPPARAPAETDSLEQEEDPMWEPRLVPNNAKLATTSRTLAARRAPPSAGRGAEVKVEAVGSEDTEDMDMDR